MRSLSALLIAFVLVLAGCAGGGQGANVPASATAPGEESPGAVPEAAAHVQRWLAGAAEWLGPVGLLVVLAVLATIGWLRRNASRGDAQENT